MRAALAILAVAAYLGVLCIPRVRCLLRGHQWSRPWTERRKRLEQCERCSQVREHVAPIGDTTTVLSQLDLDGTHGAPSAVIVDAKVASLTAYRAGVRDRAIARAELARRPSSERLQ